MNKSDITALMDLAYKLGFEYEQKYMGCAQCVFGALQDALELKNPQTDAVFKAATALSGGTALEGDGNCGAYSGAVLFLGSIIGRERNNFSDPQKIRLKTSDLARELHGNFIETYGTIICHGIHRKIFGRPFYLPDPDQLTKFDEAGAHTEKCPNVVGEAARWTVWILHENGYLPS